MQIKGLENLVTIEGKNGEIRQGELEMISADEFWFYDGLTRPNRIWGKLDYWTVIGHDVAVGKILVNPSAIEENYPVKTTIEQVAADMAMIQNMPFDECMYKINSALQGYGFMQLSDISAQLAEYAKPTLWERLVLWTKRIFTKQG